MLSLAISQKITTQAGGTEATATVPSRATLPTLAVAAPTQVNSAQLPPSAKPPPSLHQRRSRLALEAVDTLRAREVVNTEDLREEHWTPASLDYLFQMAAEKAERLRNTTLGKWSVEELAEEPAKELAEEPAEELAEEPVEAEETAEGRTGKPKARK
jgi:hypothetical protein